MFVFKQFVGCFLYNSQLFPEAQRWQ